MDTNKLDYKAERLGYYKVLGGLLLLTAVTFIQPHLFLQNSNFVIQLLIGAVKAWLIVMYYMHLKGEKLISATVMFALGLVIFFFIMIGIDVNSFQFGDVSHITSEVTSAGGHASSSAHH